jgi:hypothetical protein
MTAAASRLALDELNTTQRSQSVVRLISMLAARFHAVVSGDRQSRWSVPCHRCAIVAHCARLPAVSSPNTAAGQRVPGAKSLRIQSGYAISVPENL